MKNHNKKSSLSNGIVFSIFGVIFTAIGVALFIITLKGLIEVGIKAIGIGIIMPILFILAFLGFGITALTIGGKHIYLRIMQTRTYHYGEEVKAKIVDFKSASFSKGHNLRIRYALTLSYNYDGENKTFTTDYLFDTNEFRYLKKLDSIKVKVNSSFVVVCETFPEDIYKVDSTYGIEMEFFKQKKVALLFRLWIIFFVVAFAFLIISFFIGSSTITMVAIIAIFTIHFPFVIPLAIYLIKWLTGRKN